jgi:hypothetical protein
MPRRKKPRPVARPAAPASPVIAAVLRAAEVYRENPHSQQAAGAGRAAAQEIARHISKDQPPAPWHQQQTAAASQWQDLEPAWAPLPSSAAPERFPFI